MRKLFYVSIFLVVMLISFLGITYSFEMGNNNLLVFKLIGPETLYVDINTEYQEYGVTVTYDGKDISKTVVIDSSSVNMKTIGEYQVKYEISTPESDEYIYRKVIVIDKSAPVITLNGDLEVYLLLYGNYNENGYVAIDNLDGDVTKKVKVSGSVNTNKEGTYNITYAVSDSSGNSTQITRKVIVKKANITLDNGTGNRVTSTAYNATIYSNTIIKNVWTPTGIYYEGYVKEKSDSYKIKLKNKSNSLEYVFNMTISKDNYYKGNLDLTMVDNGTYAVYIVGKTEDKLLNKRNNLSRIIRSKAGNKLITLMYNNDVVEMSVDDFNYDYDIVIDPGHGGAEIGASNGIMDEKDMNLKVSFYEKCRYESMGYKVYMTRYKDNYGEMLGSSDLDQLQRRALTIGYYGAVSRVTYSNHHNGSSNVYASGFEMLVSNQLTAEDMIIETSLYNKYKKFYGITDNGLRLYSRDYDYGYLLNKVNGTYYPNLNYYAIIRTPAQLFNVNVTIYEPIYLSSSSDFNWYWANRNWIKISEIKIEEYVNYLGGTYTNDNSKCL